MNLLFSVRILTWIFKHVSGFGLIFPWHESKISSTVWKFRVFEFCDYRFGFVFWFFFLAIRLKIIKEKNEERIKNY